MSDLNVVLEQAPGLTVLVEEDPDMATTLTLPPATATVEVVIPGPPGPRGPAVPGQDLHYRHIQGVASATWEILHGLGKYPSITFVDSSGQEVYSDVEHVNENYARGHHSAPFSGEAFAN